MSQQAFVHTPEQAAARHESLRMTEAISALEGVEPSQELRDLNERVIRGETTLREGIAVRKAADAKKYGLQSPV